MMGTAFGPARRALSLILVILSAGFMSCGGTSQSGSPPPPPPPPGNPIVTENRKQGDPSWVINNLAQNHEIEGYASAPSVNRGETISFFVNTPESGYTMKIFRMGWYGGAGGRLMMDPISLPGTQQPPPSAPDPDTGFYECNWASTYQLKIPDNPADPTDWASGFYLVKLTGNDSHTEQYMIFIVRDDVRKSDLLYQSASNTYEAYNGWGGRSFYTTPPAYKISYNRPYDRRGSAHFTEWEYNMVRFLEREGYDVSYCTDLDTHVNGNLLLSHKGILTVGHDEYWSWEMRNNFEAARDTGVNLGFFSANTCFWQVRYEASPATGVPNRTLVGYKYDALAKDPYAKDPTYSYLTTTQWRLPPVNRPEVTLEGVMFDNLAGANIYGDIVVSDDSSFVFANTGLKNGDRLTGLLGKEIDHVWPDSPPNIKVIAQSPVPNTSPTIYSNMTVYTTSAGGTVFAAGTVQWSWGLDDYGTDHPPLANPAAQQATRNILLQFGAKPGTP
jgi:hypothetical protein